ncbi:subtilisin-like protease SBT1.2 [Amborella trichopoda]|uniref:Subtilisin-like protease SBT1.2 n=1 Tax=Amborella trichopoda TaxID=13333 RepID=U5D332_AMBTC|nr:subtilisin-like protease SBT1.2 [Amborella trichopoda]ERN15827.1 hypothetical protein AMTR_s00039p00160190 [Amborella trichopoda]|eukprot:XP_006854360.1 subtilisin-like protease SBT1.2 [Amborella trichopoda]
MGTPHVLLFFLFIFFHLLSSRMLHARELHTHIIQLHPNQFKTSGFQHKSQWHRSILWPTVAEDDDAEEPFRLLYSYEAVIEGFAALLTDGEAAAIRATPGVVAVRRDRRHPLQTTYSYKFLGLNSYQRSGPWGESGFGEGTVVGVLDTGVWPESSSFLDNGMPPVPKRWRGVCQVGESFDPSLCNRKLIGARFYGRGHRVEEPTSNSGKSRWPAGTNGEYVSARDAHGHGTHTSSTAVGAPVEGAGVVGNAVGTARGMAPRAHLAIYKVCWFGGCYSSDILAGMDDAIQDGVDVLSLSLGGFPLPFHEDSIAIGAYRAAERGVLVVCAAGNNGPLPGSVANEAPWITTVGASTLDRSFPALLRLGNGQVLYGESLHPAGDGHENEQFLELVYDYAGSPGSQFCFNSTLRRDVVQGKMVVCDRGSTGRALKGEVVKEAGGLAMVLANTEQNQEENSVDVHVLPATLIGYREAVALKKYITSTKNPRARILFRGTIYQRNFRAPGVALFSSRGPSTTNPTVLKPDVVAPGVNILAAWPDNLGPTGLLEDTRQVNFSVLSGTSMACPHVSGIAALVRSVHPLWSPAAIKSALITTADVVDHTGGPILDGRRPAGVFALGGGHVNPARAINPGLVYDMSSADYLPHLCQLGYTTSQIFTITHKNISCPLLAAKKGNFLNYPSMSVIFKEGRRHSTKTAGRSHRSGWVLLIRRVTNVGPPNSTYSVEVEPPQGVVMRVSPSSLSFHNVNESKTFRVWFRSKRKMPKGNISYAQGSLTWVHLSHSNKVRSSVAVTWVGPK